MPLMPCPDCTALQSCRPLSGAVIAGRRGRAPALHPASIVPPPFGSGYLCSTTSRALPSYSFNRAAPFRERLFSTGGWAIRRLDALQSCRPLSGAVMLLCPPAACPGTALQSCRPLSGAVIARQRRPAAGAPECFNRAAPFRERLFRLVGVIAHAAYQASIVPPPFGSGYMAGVLLNRPSARIASIVPPPFGSGYYGGAAPADANLVASIVPPPFGSGYSRTAK